MSEPQRLLAFLVLLGVAAVALRAVSHRAKLPYSVVLAVGGIVLGLLPGGRLYSVGPDLILLAFVPGLVFQAAFTLHLGQLRRLAGAIAALSTLAVVVGVLAFGATAHALLGLGWTDAMVLGAILAPTDPIAVVRLLRRCAVRRRSLRCWRARVSSTTGRRWRSSRRSWLRSARALRPSAM